MNKLAISGQLKEGLIAGAIALMFGGLLCSRFLLSAGSLLFVLFAFIPARQTALSLLTSQRRYYYLLAILFILPLVSGMWSADRAEWWARVVVKLPFLIFPLAFAVPGPVSAKQEKRISLLFAAVILCGSGWSFIKYLGNATALNDSYHYAGVIPTPMEDDHVRFSWAVLIALLLLVRLFFMGLVKKGKERAMLLLLMAWLVVYLHILAAKTGLAGLYIAAVILLLQRTLKTGRRKWLLPGGFILIILPLAAYWLLPSFHHRIHYIIYDFEQYKQLHFPGGLPDGARVLSWIRGWFIFTAHPFAGIGYGDVWGAIQQWYAVYYPHTPLHDRLFPSNQYLLYACACGIPGLLVFTATAFYPLFCKAFRWLPVNTAFHAAAVFFFFSEMHLEGQYGVFLYCFFALWLSRPVS